MGLDEAIELAANRLREARTVTVATGAGISVASGIPCFRGNEGIWKDFRPEEVATPQAFQRDPKFVWEWYDHRREELKECQPNRGHEVLAAWSRRFSSFTLITQNVDGLHELAGTRNVIRYHGSLWEVGCWEDCPDSPYRWEDRTCPFPEHPPKCPYCNGILRPGVVWFGEMIDPQVLTQSSRATRCEVFLTIGTSSLVYPAASLVSEAKTHGAYTIEINPETTPAEAQLDLYLPGKAEEVLDSIDSRLNT